MARYRQAFTLIELLVVIVIITVLIALLLPALRAAREAAVTARCISNIRQCAFALNTYAQEWGGNVPYHSTVYNTPGNGQKRVWSTYLKSGQDFVGGVAHKTIYVDAKTTWCPKSEFYNAKMVAPYKYSTSTDNFAYAIYSGGAQAGNVTFGRMIDYSGAVPADVSLENVLTVTFPSGMVFLGDSAWDSTGFSFPVQMMGTFKDNGVSGDWGGAIRTLHGQQGELANVVFFDGHGETLTAQGLRNGTVSRISRTYDIAGLPVIVP